MLLLLTMLRQQTDDVAIVDVTDDVSYVNKTDEVSLIRQQTTF